MYNFSFRWKSIAAAVAALSVFAVASLAQAPARNYKDGEYDIYNAVTKDLLSKDYNKAIADLDAWKQKYADSDFKDDRAMLYVSAYSESKQFGKALDATSDALGMPNAFSD